MRWGITAIGSCSYRSGSGHGASPSTRRRDGLRYDHTQSAQLGRCRRTDKTGSFNALVRLTFEQLPVGGGCGRLGGFARLALRVYGKIRVPLIAEPLILFSLPPTLDNDLGLVTAWLPSGPSGYARGSPVRRRRLVPLRLLKWPPPSPCCGWSF